MTLYFVCANFKVDIEYFVIFLNRYSIGETDLPFFTQWVKQILNIDLSVRNIPREKFNHQELPSAYVPIGLY